MDTVIIITFLLAYLVWLLSWARIGKWKPQEPDFVVADVIYASATVMAFFHLTHIFQVRRCATPRKFLAVCEAGKLIPFEPKAMFLFLFLLFFFLFFVFLDM